MFRVIGSIIKLVTMISALLVAVEQLKEVLAKRKARKNAESAIENARAA